MKKSNILKKLLETSAGREKLAAAMAAPLSQILNYNSVARKAFRLHRLCLICGKGFAPEELSWFNEDFNKISPPPSYDDPFSPDVDELLICKKCEHETRAILKNIEKASTEDLPLHINHSNIFVKARVIKKLKNG